MCFQLLTGLGQDDIEAGDDAEAGDDTSMIKESLSFDFFPFFCKKDTYLASFCKSRLTKYYRKWGNFRKINFCIEKFS